MTKRWWMCVTAAFAALWLGVLSNMTALLINHGMPVVDGRAANTWTHHVATRADRLPVLWDWIPLGAYHASIGDFLLLAGLLMLGAAAVRYLQVAFKR